MDLRLQDKIAVVTGSTRGIGLGVAEVLLEEGARVCVTGRDGPRLAAVEDRLSKLHGTERVLAIQGDASAGAEVMVEVATRTVERFGGLDVLVANVGIGSGQGGLEADDFEWERLLSLNLMSAVHAIRAAAPYMKTQGGGSIVLVSSIVAVEATSAPLPYSAAKAAVNSLSKNLSRQLAGDGIRVNVVLPGNVLHEGGSWERKLRDNGGAVMEYIESTVPMKRFGTPREIANAVAFLASEAACGFTTGASLLVDGGQTRTV